MQIQIIYLIKFVYIIIFFLTKTNGYLTKHEADELHSQIKELHTKLEACNIRFNSLILSIIQNKSKFDISEYLTSSPYLYDESR
jgi:hypothetical protein